MCHFNEQHALAKKYKCKYCKDHFYKVHQRARHEQEVHVKVDIVCSLCTRHFLSKKSLRKHFHYIHEDVEKLKCPYCDSELLRGYSLTEHIRTLHLDEKVECDLCGVRYTRKTLLRDHMEIHDSGAKSSRCEICNRLCINSRSHKFHMMAFHTGKVECEHCHKDFLSKHFLTRHMRCRKSCVVDSCGEIFACSTLRKTHENTAHDYSCTLCESRQKNSTSLRQHAFRHHNSVKCAHCELLFIGTNALKKHQLSTHDIFNCKICKTSLIGNEKEHYTKQHSACRTCKFSSSIFEEILRCESTHRAQNIDVALCLKSYAISYCSLEENEFFVKVHDDVKDVKYEFDRVLPSTLTGNISVITEADIKVYIHYN